MIYKDFQNLKLSALGMGAMRLPVIGGDDGAVNEGETERMVSYAMDHGINYYDTAWGYHNGQSELVLGKALSKYPQETAFTWQISFQGMTCLIWGRLKKSLKNSWRNAE